MGVFEDYVSNYGDLKSAFGNASEAGGLYVDENSDLAAEWKNNENNKKFREKYPRKRDYGSWHYANFGKEEGRTMWYFYGPESDGIRVKGAEGWGQKHWETSGNKEDRILSGAKFNIDSNGKLYVANTEGIGEKAKKRYDDVVSAINNAKEGTYKSVMESLGNRLGDVGLKDLIDANEIDTLAASYQKRITPWDSSNAAQPPTGSFDATYYRTNTTGGSQAESEWDAAQESVSVGGEKIPDLDVVGRYSLDSYLHWHYSTQGKAAGYRGNEASLAELPEYYEEAMTDAEYQQYRDKVLGIEGDTILSKSVGTELSGKEKQLQQQFGSLTNDSLKKAADELVKAKAKERDFEFYKGLEGFNEVMTINETITNSLLGDSGIGGILGFVTNPEKVKESLEESLSKSTGIPTFNGVTYNWQKWFDEQLAGNYEKGITVSDPTDPTKTYTLTGDFAKRYIDEYLKPRFDSSKSMSEFISTLELQQQDKNIFDTQTALVKLKDIADVRAKAYLDDVYSTAPLNFDADFYMNPTGNFTEDDPKVAKYTEQSAQVAKDWETAKKNGETKVEGTDWTWNQWAYHYGLDISDKTQFAKLHYQVFGASNGFDPAKDVITLKDATDYINNKILPEIAEKDIDLADIKFLQFVTPEEFADSVIEGVSPETNKEEWDKMLSTLGISGEGMGVDDVKKYIADQFRTNNAINVREAIKYLNEKGVTPTQKKIGVEYIQRSEDAKETTSPYATSLYKVFKNAGYQGSEDDFYGKFMTDVSKEEMQLMEQGASDKGLQLGGAYAGLTSSDPFTALGSLSSFFGSKETGTEKEKAKASYFKLLDDEEKENYQSKSGEQILGEFTSLFKGFT